MYGLDGYTPHLVGSAAELAEREGPRLGRLVGQRLTATWLLWDTDDDEWFSDGPVILRFAESQLELSAWKASEFLVSWDGLDPTRPIPSEDTDLRLAWRQAPTPATQKVLGEQLLAIDVRQYADDSRTGDMLVGLDFRFQDGFLRIFNALDENGLSSSPDQATGEYLTRLV